MFGYESVKSKEGDSKYGVEVDLEGGEGAALYPGLSHGENILRWAFIRKVYGILTAQILLTTAVSAATVLYSPINDLLRGNSGLLLLFCILPFVHLKMEVEDGNCVDLVVNCLLLYDDGVLWPLHMYHQKHPVNLIVLGLFTVSLSLPVAVSCANTDGRIVLEALILTSAVVFGLTGYTFWAAKKGKDFSFLGPILFTSLLVLILTSFMQMFFPLGPTSVAVYGGISAVVFCGYIVYDTDNLIKRFTYDEYILASVTLYLDILNLFITILRVLRQSDG
ncbi:hypothetical protein JRO89_XS03G0189700 [Xanthoceras sorbifolium]|uniref:BI1-like protein n=1 Tax=Xanthoceras sorbifolium TaxID=99658 RepID=A0ABQ8IBK4_9ROSI|nr:hypothetical protein JRO89_XS03G0189700 [Xanthoceras sorbifolium]